MPKLLNALRTNSFFLCIVPTAIFGCGFSMAGERPLKGGEITPAAIYHNYCSVCHGDRGNGDSRARGSLVPPPRDFTTATNLGRETMITITTHGKPSTAMVGWKTQLTPAEIEAVVDYIRESFMIVAIDPRMQRGKTLYAHNCIVCHGDRGQGSPLPIGGATPAKNLSTPQARAELSRERMIESVTNGRSGTAMAGFAGRLPPQDIAAIVDYVRAALMIPESDTISGTHAHGGRSGNAPEAASPPKKSAPVVKAEMSLLMPYSLTGNAERGKKFYDANCATCHGVKGDGKGPRAYFINPKPRIFTSAESRATLNRPMIFATVSMGKLGTEMPAWSKVISPQEIADVSEYVFQSFIRPVKKAAQK